jgi:hypothetical protein
MTCRMKEFEGHSIAMVAPADSALVTPELRLLAKAENYRYLVAIVRGRSDFTRSRDPTSRGADAWYAGVRCSSSFRMGYVGWRRMLG